MKKTFKHFFCLFVAMLFIGQMWATDYTIYQATSSGVDCADATETGISVTFNGMKRVNNSPITSVANTTYGIEADLKAPRWGGNGDGKNITIVVSENYTATIAAYVQTNTAKRKISIKTTDVAPANTDLVYVNCESTETVYEVKATDLEAGTYYIKADGDKIGLIKLVASVTSTGGGAPAVDETAPTLSSSSPANSATGVDVSGTIVLTFSEAIASVDGSKFSLSGATIGTVAIDGTDAKKVNIPYSGASNSATVTLSVAADAVADAAGNKSAALSDISFTTVAAGYSVTHTLTNVTTKSGATGAGAAAVGVDYDAVFKSGKVGYTLPATISVTIGGNDATVDVDYTWNASTGAFQVPAAKVTGNIVVTIVGVAPTKTTKSTYTDFTQVGETNAYYTYLNEANYNAYAVAGWMVYEGESKGDTKLLIDPEDDAETTPSSTSSYGKVKQVGSRYMEFYLTGVLSVKFYFHNGGGDGRTAKYKLNNGSEVDLVAVTKGTSNSGIIENLDPTAENTIRVYASADIYLCAMKVTLPVAPTITDPTSTPDAAEYTVGDETSALSVTASGTPTLTYQWYSNSTASTSEATTLTNCTTATYTPSSAVVSDLYYYCVVTNVAGSATSPFFRVTVNAPALPTHSISYDNLKGQSVTGYPTEYYETVGVASFDPLADVTGFHFTGWSPASIATTATTDQTITAQWTPTYSVTYNLNGAASGTLPTETAKYENQVFVLAAQGDIVAPTDKMFLGWKDQDGNKYDAEADYTMPGKAVTLTAYWALRIEDIIYSWEGGSEGATEVGGTATSTPDGGKNFNDAELNVSKSDYRCIQLNGKADYSTNYVQIALSGNEKVKTGDKIRYTGFYTNAEEKSAAVKMRTSDGTDIFTGDNLPRIETTSPRTDTYVVPEGINAAVVQITRHKTQTSSFLTKLEIIRESYVDEDNLLTVTFNYNDGGATANKVVDVALGSAVSAPADPTWAHHRFHEWQLGGSAYNFSTPVTSNITLTADWTQLYTISFANGGGSGDAPSAIADKAKDETFEVPANTYTAPEGKEFDKWNDGTNDYAPSATYTVGTANVTLTAVWKVKEAIVETYTLSYNKNGGSGDAMDNTVGAGSISLRKNTYTQSGYVFIGWATSLGNAAAGTVAYLDGASYTLSANAELFAVWSPESYSFTPATSGDKPAVNATISSSTGGTMKYTPKDDTADLIAYASQGLFFQSSSKCVVTITLDKVIKEGTVFTVVLTNAGDTKSGRGIKLNINSTDKDTWTWDPADANEEVTFQWTVPADDNAIGKKEFKLIRVGNAYLKSLTVTNTAEPTPDYTRSLTAGRFGTICLPNGGTIEGAAIYEIVYKEASQIFFDEVDGGVMIAGRPYIFYPYSGSTELKVYYTDNLSADAGNHNGLYGSYSETVLDPNDGNYILYNNMYYLVNSTAYVGANRAYIKLGEVPNQPQAPTPGRRRISMQVQGEQIATGIIDAENAEQPMKVMIDNKLYIIRAGQMYDMTGSKVK